MNYKSITVTFGYHNVGLIISAVVSALNCALFSSFRRGRRCDKQCKIPQIIYFAIIITNIIVTASGNDKNSDELF